MVAQGAFTVQPSRLLRQAMHLQLADPGRGNRVASVARNLSSPSDDVGSGFAHGVRRVRGEGTAMSDLLHKVSEDGKEMASLTARESHTMARADRVKAQAGGKQTSSLTAHEYSRQTHESEVRAQGMEIGSHNKQLVDPPVEEVTTQIDEAADVFLLSLIHI